MKMNMIVWLGIAAIVVGAAYYFITSPRMTSQEVMEEDAVVAQSVTLDLTEQNDLGQSGVATLVEDVDGNLVVTLAMIGGEFTEPQPAHIHVGACPEPGAVEYPLTNVVDGESETTLDVSWADLVALGEPLAINVHKSATEASVYTACGDLPLTESMMEEEVEEGAMMEEKVENNSINY